MKRCLTAKEIALKALASVLVYGNDAQKREARQLIRVIERAAKPGPAGEQRRRAERKARHGG
jgi:hypothetical protein